MFLKKKDAECSECMCILNLLISISKNDTKKNVGGGGRGQKVAELLGVFLRFPLLILKYFIKRKYIHTEMFGKSN